MMSLRCSPVSRFQGDEEGTAEVPESSRDRPRLLGDDVFLVRAPDGSARLLGLDGEFAAISEVAAAMLDEAGRLDEAAAMASLAARFAAPIERVLADFRGLLLDLRRRGFLADGEGAQRQRPGRWADAAYARLVRSSLRSQDHVGWMLALAWVGFRALGWTRTARAWRLGSERPATGANRLDIAEIERRVVAAVAFSPVPVTCKERGVVAWALSRQSGWPARLVLGVDLYPFRAHCWCVADGQIVADHADRCVGYTPFHEEGSPAIRSA